MSNAVARTPKVSTNIVPASVDGSSMDLIVEARHRPDHREREADRPVHVASLSLGRVGLGRELDRKVGHRGGCPSVRSKRSIGKFDSMPPSTM
jgi:hypothetical protein